MATVVEVLAKLKADTGQFNREMQGAAGQLQRAGATMTSVGGSLTRSVTLPLVGLGAAAVFTASQFESSMSKIVGLVGIAADEVDGMREGVLSISGETAKAPIELADALFVVTSAGLRGEDAMGALDAAARASAAGLGETADISRALAGAMNAYGSDVLDAAQATDVIVATARAGNFETSQFAAAIGRVLPFAKQAQASFADMGGAVALLTRTNGDAAQSVTQMAALFRSFVVPTRQAQDVLSSVGMTAEELRDSMGSQGLVPTLQMLDDALGGNREQLGRLLGSSEAAAAAFQILDADADTLAATFGEVNNAAGITDEAFAAVENTTGFKLQKAMTNFKTVLIEIGDILAPMVQRVSDFISRMLAGFKSLPDEVQQIIVVLAGVAAAIGPVLLVVGKLATIIGTVSGAIGGAGGLAGVLAALTGPVGIVIAAIAGLVAIVVAMWRESEVFRDAVMNAFNTVKDAVTGAIGTIQGALEDNADSLNTLRQVFKALGDFIGTFIIPLWANYLSKVIGVVVWLIARWIDYMGFLLRAFQTALPYVLDFAAEVMKGLGGMVDFVLGALEAMIDGLATALGWVPGLGDKLNEARDAVSGFRDQVARNFKDVEASLRGASDSTEQWGEDSVNALEDYRDAAVRARGATEEYQDAAVRAAGGVSALRSDTDLLTDVTNAAASATVALNDAFSGLQALFSETRAMDRAYTMLQDFREQMDSNAAGFDGYSDAAMANRGAFMDWADSQIAAAQGLDDPIAQLEALKDIQREARDALLEQGLKPAESDFYQGVKDLVQDAKDEVDGLKDAVTTAEVRGLDVASAIAQGVSQGMSQQEAAMNGAGLLAGDAVANGLNTSLGISSPSRVAMEAGRDTALGLANGLQDMNLSITNGGNLAGQALIDGIIAGLDARAGSLYARIRSIIAAAIASANAAAGAQSAPPPTTGSTSSGMSGQGTRSRSTQITVNVNSAPGESAAVSVPRALRRAAWLAGLDD